MNIRSRFSRSSVVRGALLGLFLLALAGAQLRDSLWPEHAARLEVVVRRADTGALVAARVYLFKGDTPFRLSPVDSMLPLRADLFYRERIWRKTQQPKTLEVTARDSSHFILLDGSASFDLPAAVEYRIEAYHGTFFHPAIETFSLDADGEKTIELTVEPVAPGRQERWISADDHIHLMRDREDDAIFLKWLAAEDLGVGNFLELQRQQHAAVQYAFGEDGEAHADGFSIRSGHESRSRFYGHTLFLGPNRMIRPLSIGLEYANSPESYPYPSVLFTAGRRAGALTGFAHFYGSQPNSTLLMDLAHGDLDFVELFQFGELKTTEWYELLNAGFRVVGLAGSDFPANIGRMDPWPRILPLLGPERTLAPARAGSSTYEAWAEGVRQGEVVVTNGPLLELAVNEQAPGATVDWQGESLMLQGSTFAAYHRPIEGIEILLNGEVAARIDSQATTASFEFELEIRESAWIAARAIARSEEGEPVLQAHTNPVYFLRDGDPVAVESAREALRGRWRTETEYYRNGELVFSDESQRQEFLLRVEETSRLLAR